MYRTVFIGSCVAIQGLFVRTLTDGRVQVRVGDKLFSGVPAEAA